MLQIQIWTKSTLIMKNIIMLILLISSFKLLYSQHNHNNHDNKHIISGRVVSVEIDSSIVSLPGATVHWQGTRIATVTNKDGYFEIEHIESSNKLIAKYVGFEPDTIEIVGHQHDGHIIVLNNAVELSTVEIIERVQSTYVSMTSARKTLQIDEKELKKAACCSLSESFETNPSVDVSFTDAITGTRQIKMLGLAGPYTQITRENMPDVRGLSAISGMTYTPGPWISSIQLIKGAGSVVNGYESIAGQINVELFKPDEMDKLFLNLYGNIDGATEFNSTFKFDVGKHLKTAFLVHGMTNQFKSDHNNDGFRDMPNGNRIIAVNRWHLANKEFLHSQFGVKYTYVDQIGGQMDFEKDQKLNDTTYWGMLTNIKRIEGWLKIGKIYKNRPWSSTALQISAINHNQDYRFGLNEYKAQQQTLYANLLHNGRFGDDKHSFKTGLSFQADKYDEVLNNTTYLRNEVVPGAFYEYSFTPNDKYGLVAGLRADNHNNYGLFFTPRLHLRFAPVKNTVFRASMGRGLKTANVISENLAFLAGSREWKIHSNDNNNPYGLDAETAWNYGVNFTQKFEVNYREASIQLDYYYTDFENQIVIDMDQNSREINFYNLDGKSFASSFQAQFDMEVFKRTDLRLAYRFYDVKTNYNGKLMTQPLLANHRAFINLAYESYTNWKYDLTLNWQGSQRIPDLSANPEEYQLPTKSPDYITVNAQITKVWDNFELYIGGENLLNYKQEDPIVAANDPFGKYFDSSLIWGPIFGRKLYFGMRYYLR